MPTNTYTPLANITLSSSASSVTFSSISQAYRDLILVVDGTSTVDMGTGIQYNGDTGSNYTFVQMYGTGSSTGSLSGTAAYTRIEAMYTTRTIKKIQIMDYSATDKHKTILTRNDWPGGEVDAIAARWANTAAITSMVFYSVGSTLAAGTTLALYGVAA